jgi:hypothetical protein
MIVVQRASSPPRLLPHLVILSVAKDLKHIRLTVAAIREILRRTSSVHLRMTAK